MQLSAEYNLSHRGKPAARPSCHPTQLQHVFMRALLNKSLWLPSCQYQENPLAPLQLLSSTVKTSMGLPTNRGSVTWKHLFFHFVQVSQAHLGRICHQVSKRRYPNPRWTSQSRDASRGLTTALFCPNRGGNFAISAKGAGYKSLLWFTPYAPEDAFQKEKPTYSFGIQNPKEDLKSEAKYLLSMWLLFWGARQEEQMAQQPLAESLTRQSINPPSWTGFLPSGSIPLFWLKHLIKK